MKFLWCTQHVKNLEASLGFYREIIGLDVRRRCGAKPGPLLAFLGGEGSEIELIEDGRESPAEYGKDISLGFEVKNLEEKMAFAKEKGVPILSGPIQPSPNIRFCFVQDPDGLLIQFVQFIPT